MTGSRDGSVIVYDTWQALLVVIGNHPRVSIYTYNIFTLYVYIYLSHAHTRTHSLFLSQLFYAPRESLLSTPFLSAFLSQFFSQGRHGGSDSDLPSAFRLSKRNKVRGALVNIVNVCFVVALPLLHAQARFFPLLPYILHAYEHVYSSHQLPHC